MKLEVIDIIINTLEAEKENYDNVGISYENDTYYQLVLAIEAMQNLHKYSYVPCRTYERNSTNGQQYTTLSNV